VVLLALAAAAAWWWTRPPRASAAELQQALRLAPAQADGAVAVAEPSRAGRFLARRPQAILLLAAAAGPATEALASLRPTALALGAAARGPLVLWWQGGEGAVAARLEPAARGAFLEVAARGSAVATCGGDWCAVATVAELLPRDEEPADAAVASSGALAALGRVGGRLWEVRARERWVEASAGTAPPCPTPRPDRSAVALPEAGALLAQLGVRGVPVGPVRLAADDGNEWAVAFPRLRLEGLARRLLGGPPAGTPEPSLWRGLAGAIWVSERDGTALASSPAALALLPDTGADASQGVIHGRHAAWLLSRAASLAGRIPGLPLRQRDLTRAAALAQEIDAVSFRVEAGGGRIVLTW